MKNISSKLCILIFLFTSVILSAQQSISTVNATYSGRIEYVFGTFYSFNPPAANDSVETTIVSDSLHVKFFSAKDITVPRYPAGFTMAPNTMKQKKEYKDVISIDEEKTTGSYDVKYSIAAKDNSSNLTIQVVHNADGTMANLVITDENNGYISDMLTARITKIK